MHRNEDSPLSVAVSAPAYGKVLFWFPNVYVWCLLEIRKNG